VSVGGVAGHRRFELADTALKPLDVGIGGGELFFQ